MSLITSVMHHRSSQSTLRRTLASVVFARFSPKNITKHSDPNPFAVTGFLLLPELVLATGLDVIP